MGLEIDDKEFEELIAEKRHMELTGILKGVKLLLEKPADKSVADAIGKLIEKLEGLKPPEVKMPELKAPDVNVTVDNKEVVNLMKELLPELKKLNGRPIVDSFKLETGTWGAKTVKVIYKK